MATRFDKNKYKSKKKWRDSLTDNVKANEFLSPIYFIFTYFLLDPTFTLKIDILLLTIISTMIYIYSSSYYQPDLDVNHSRPGMGHFPLGRWWEKFFFGRFLKMVFYPVNRFWYWLWHPYAKLFTHRGISHWPIISTMLRALYLYFWINFFLALYELLGFNVEYIEIFLKSIETWTLAFFPNSNLFWTNYWFLFCFPVYLSDIIHIFVDFIDSTKRGLHFCPPKIPRGLIYKTFSKFFKKK